MYKNAIVSKGKFDLVYLRVIAILVLVSHSIIDRVRGDDEIVPVTPSLRDITFDEGINTDNLRFFNPSITPDEIYGTVDRRSPKTTIETPVTEWNETDVNSTTSVDISNATESSTRRRCTKRKKTTWMLIAKPTLIRGKIVRTVMVRLPKRKWHLYNENYTTYDIEAYRRAKRRKKRAKWQSIASMHAERRKLGTTTTTEVTFVEIRRRLFPLPHEVPRGHTKDWWYNTQQWNDTIITKGEIAFSTYEGQTETAKATEATKSRSSTKSRRQRLEERREKKRRRLELEERNATVRMLYEQKKMEVEEKRRLRRKKLEEEKKKDVMQRLHKASEKIPEWMVSETAPTMTKSRRLRAGMDQEKLNKEKYMREKKQKMESKKKKKPGKSKAGAVKKKRNRDGVVDM